MTHTSAPSVAVAPDGADAETLALVEAAGARLAPLDEADALVWTVSNLRGFPERLPQRVRWVQLPSAGIESWLAAGVVDAARVWTSAVGAYAQPVAEHALSLLLAGLRQMPASLAATTWRKDDLMPLGRTLRGARVGIYGAGGIARELIPMLAALGAETVAVNRSGRPVVGAVVTMPASEVDAHRFWETADHVVVAAPSTAETKHLVSVAELDRMRHDAWLVNVARGELVDTDALVKALDDSRIAGAALDVTDPEPLPDGHPLYRHPRAIVTPHIANPTACLDTLLRQRIAENLGRFVRGDGLIGVVDLTTSY